MKHSIVSRWTEGAFRYQAWPTVTKAEDGTLFVGTSGHRLNHICPFGKDLMYVSCDEGETWSAPQIINDTYLDDRDAGMLAWGDGNLLLTYFSHGFDTFDVWEKADKPYITVNAPWARGMRALWETLPADQYRPGSWTRISRDNGKTWSESRRAPVSSPHGPCRLQDGTLLYVGSFVAPDGTYDDGGVVNVGNRTNRIQMFQSTDDGETWQFLSVLPWPEGADIETYETHEPHAIQMANGDILAVVRYQPSSTPVMKRLQLYSTVSHDNGKTWEEAQILDLCGAPGHLLQHSSGAVILSYCRRADPQGQYIKVSYDFGKTWSAETLISDIVDHWDHGYPSSVELSNGDVLTVYYQKCPGDDYNSLHSVRWSLSEVRK